MKRMVESEIADILNEKLQVNENGIIINEALSAKTLTQQEPSYSANFEFSTSSGLTITNVYNRCLVINNVFHLIVNILVKNTSGAAKKIGGGWADPAFKALVLPASVAKKIIDFDGKTVHDADATAKKLITSVHATCAKGTVSAGTLVTYNDFRFDFTNFNVEDNAACYFNSNTAIELQDGEEIALMSRLSLTLL